MNDEPKKQEPEIMPPGPKVEPERPGPEIPSDKDVPERESHIRAADGARHGTNFIVMILPSSFRWWRRQLGQTRIL